MAGLGGGGHGGEGEDGIEKLHNQVIWPGVGDLWPVDEGGQIVGSCTRVDKSSRRSTVEGDVRWLLFVYLRSILLRIVDLHQNSTTES